LIYRLISLSIITLLKENRLIIIFCLNLLIRNGKALFWCEKAFIFDQEREATLLLLGALYQEEGISLLNFKSAIYVYEKLEKFDGKNAHIAFYLALAYQYAGD
jgi:hypothetical protein